MKTLLQDIRFGVRLLFKNPSFTVIAIITLALGIGANTALFSVMDAVLLKKLQVKEPDRLVLFKSVAGPNFSAGSYTGNSSTNEAGQRVMTSFPYQTYKAFRAQESALSDVFAFGNVSLNVNANGEADVPRGQAVSGNYYRGLGVPAFLGRTLTDEDDNAAAAPVAVISHRYWQKRFGGDKSVVGKQININGVSFTVVGITPPGFDGTMQVGSSMDVSIPIAWEPQIVTDRSRMKGEVWWLRLMGRLKQGATLEQAQASLALAFQQSVIEHRTARQTLAQVQGAKPVSALDPNDYPQLQVTTGNQGEMNMRQFYQKPIYFLFGVVGLVLLIACANVANLLLVRANSRQKEIAVRLAIGASRWRLIRQLLTESILLAGLGGVLGVLLAIWLKDGLLAVGVWGGRGMNALNPQLDLRVLGFTVALSLLTGILFGMIPAWRSTKVDLTPTLKDNARGSSISSRSWLTKVLVVAQVAMSLLLLIGAGLFLRTLINLQRTEAGFNANNLLLFSVEPGLIGYKDERLVNLYKQMSERIESVPGVRSVTFSRVPLLAESSSSRAFFLQGTTASADGKVKESGGVYIHSVRENFLEAMEIPLLLGRNLKEQDDTKAPSVIIINETFARRYFPNQNPIGKRIGFDSDKTSEIEIVGVAKDAKYTRQRDEIPPTAYIPWKQALRSVNSLTFEVRTTGEPTAAVSAIRQAVKEVDPNLPVNNIKTQTEQAEETLAMERLFAKLLSLFGLLAQQLASIGLYGVLAWSVSQRTHEIGIRMALGASRGAVLKMILRQGLILALVGVVLGLAGAYVLTKYLVSLTSMLYGVNPFDPLTFGVIAGFLMLVALVACYIPARRATKVEPMIALRYE